MTRCQIPADPPPGAITAIIDTREQSPLCLDPLAIIPGTLSTGDYSVKGLEDVISVERKSLPDLLGCIGQSRERFERELVRLLAYPHRAVVVEAHWSDLEAGGWQGKVTSQSATGSVLGWMAMGIPFLFVGSHQAAGIAVSRFLYIAARRRWRECREFLKGMQTPEEPELIAETFEPELQAKLLNNAVDGFNAIVNADRTNGGAA